MRQMKSDPLYRKLPFNLRSRRAMKLAKKK